MNKSDKKENKHRKKKSALLLNKLSLQSNFNLAFSLSFEIFYFHFCFVIM